MPERLVMGYWDCPYCDTVGIEGVKRECPNCGKPRGEDTSFYMKAGSHEEVVSRGDYLTDEQSASKGKGEDWKCAYCGGLNSVLDGICASCGHARDDADEGYFEMRSAVEERKAVGRAADPVSGQGDASGRFPVRAWNAVRSWVSEHTRAAVLIAIAVVLLIAGSVASMPVERDFHVGSKDWTLSVDVEQYRYVDEDDWYLPDGADLSYTSSELHHYDQVFDHYEERERSYQERVQSGSHVEYSYKDNGDGTFTEVSRTVPDYSYETRYTTYREPVFRDVPVYATRYHYKIWRWIHKETVSNEGGEDDEPTYPAPELADDEKLGDKVAVYRLHGYYDDDANGEGATLEVDADRYHAVSTGDVLRVKTGLGNSFVSFVD